MKLIHQYATREQAKRLEELGVQLNYCKMMLVNGGHDTELIVENVESLKSPLMDPQPTPSVAELGIIIPDGSYTRPYYQGKDLFWESDDSEAYSQSGGLTEAQARADMLIFLIENNNLSINVINKNLQEE